MSIDVSEKVHFSIFAHNRGSIENPHRYRVLHTYSQGAFVVHCRTNAFLSPFRVVAKNPHCQRDGIFDANTSMTEVAPGFCEEFLRRCSRLIFFHGLRFAVRDRAGMVACMKKTPAGWVVLVEKTDRLYRNLKDWVTLDELDLEIHFAKENVILHASLVHLGHLRLDNEVIDWVREALRQSQQDERRAHHEAIARLQFQYDTLKSRVEAMYLDRLDGRIDTGFYDRKASEWRKEQSRLTTEIQNHRQSGQSYLSEGVRLLEIAARPRSCSESSQHRRRGVFSTSYSRTARGRTASFTLLSANPLVC